MSSEAVMDSLQQALINALIEAQGADGGFGYLAGRPSATEPTALASLALSCLTSDAAREPLARSRRWLLAHQLPSGGWPARESDPEESWTAALALLALADNASSKEARQRGLSWLIKEAGGTVKVDPKVFAIDGSLRGWPWAPGNFSWVEPTAYALMVLKKLRSEAGGSAPSRIAEGEALLFDRVLDQGGWNYGNRRVYGQAYEPYAETTAVVLLALQDYPNRTDIQRSLGTLRRAVSQNSASGLQIGWGMLCLRAFGLSEGDLGHKLSDVYKRTGFLGRVPTQAVSLLALSGNAGVKPFKPGDAS